MAVKKVKKATVSAAVAVAETLKAPSKIRKAAAPKKKDSSYVLIDHPLDGEMIGGLHYAIRIGSSDNGSVELSFNNGEWQPCRASAGYWWFDWGYFTPGTYKLTARLRDNKGTTVKKSNQVQVEVK